MPDVTFNIEGDGSTQFVSDWAMILGYKLQVRNDDGDLVNNTQPMTEFIISNIFTEAKRKVRSYRVGNELEAIKETIDTSLQDISLGV